jgi:hypothetical protein
MFTCYCIVTDCYNVMLPVNIMLTCYCTVTDCYTVM